MDFEKRGNTIVSHDIMPPELWMAVVDHLHPLTFAKLFVAHPRLGGKLRHLRNKGAADKICIGFAYGTLSPTNELLTRYAHDPTFTTEGCVQLRKAYRSLPVKDRGSILATYIQSTTLDGDSHCRVMLLRRYQWMPLTLYNYDPLVKAPLYVEAQEMDDELKHELAIVDKDNIVCNAPFLKFIPEWVRIYNNNNLWHVDSLEITYPETAEAFANETVYYFVVVYEMRGGHYSATYNHKGVLVKCAFEDGRVEHFAEVDEDDYVAYDKFEIVDRLDFEDRVSPSYNPRFVPIPFYGPHLS